MVEKLSETELAEYKEAFSLFDKNGDGSICGDELKEILISLGNSPTDEEISEMIKEVDSDGNGRIDFPEFLQMMIQRGKRHSKQGVSNEIRDAFRIFDQDGDGYITTEEMRCAVKNLGEVLSDTDVDEMMREADVDGDGKISYQEFLSMMMSQR